MKRMSFPLLQTGSETAHSITVTQEEAGDCLKKICNEIVAFDDAECSEKIHPLSVDHCKDVEIFSVVST